MARRDTESLLLLGGARHQIPAIQAARRLGLRTVLCDYLPDNPGQFFSDVFYRESTTNRERILEIAREEGVGGVLSFGTDVAAPTAAYVCERLGLPTNPLSAVETLSEKHLFRDHLSRCGFPCPRHATLSVDASASEVAGLARRMRPPVVLKPTDSSGSKGVTVLDDPEGESVSRALASAREYSRNGTLVLEEFILPSFPRVVGGDVFVVDGEVRFWGLMSCLRDELLGGLVPVGERWPSGLSGAQLGAVREQVQALVSSLGIRFGEMNVEVIVGEGDTPYLLELAARAGGNMIPLQLSDVSGIDLVEANVRYAMGDRSLDVSFDGVSADGAFCTYLPHVRERGLFEGIVLDPRIAPYVYRQDIFVELGEEVAPLNNASKALGVLFLRFPDASTMEDALAIMDELVSVCLG